MKKNKIFLILLCLLVLFSVTGCGSSNKDDAEYGYYTREDGKRIWYKK